jgi:hypothetical protein
LDGTLERKKIHTKLPAVVVEKWSDTVLDEGFVPFPKRLLRCMTKIFRGPDTALSQLAVVLVIVDYRRPNLARPPSVRFLAFNAGMGVEEFERHAAELVRLGLLTRQDTQDGVKFGIRGLLQEILKCSEGED